MAVTVPRLLPLEPAVWNRLAGPPRILLFDIDGTLAPIAPTPEDASVPAETRVLLADLAAVPDTTVVLVTGRAATEARMMVPDLPLWVIGNHGAERMTPDGIIGIEQSVAGFREQIAEASHRLAARVAAIPGILVENKTWTLSIHYRLVDPSAVPGIRTEVVRTAAELGLLMAEGKMVYEVKPPVQVHKGTAVRALLTDLGHGWSARQRDHAAILFAGDDVTDEDAFRLLRESYPRAVTVKVSPLEAPETAAEFVLRDPREVRQLLEQLAARRPTASSSRPA